MSAPNHLIVKPSLKDEDGALVYYSNSAASYDWRTSYETVHHREAMRLMGIRQGDRVLEVACGTGRATVELVRLVGSTGRLDALDLTQAMLQKAQEKIRKRNLTQRVEFRTGSALQLPYAERTFDALYNAYMFDLIAEEQFRPILAEFWRVLKPGGKLMLVNMSKNRDEKTLYESLYEKGWAGACRPVSLSSYLQATGFRNVIRLYRRNAAFLVPLPFGTEIVSGEKPTE